ncbi:MAG: RNA polymerase subunit sigma-70, partial [Dehalococcoidia bacterium]|nr:RNA polymerase subunit sigma-70 [Dehalococcoidia bacterium]
THFDQIQAISSFHVPEWSSPWSRVPGARFGAHQFQDHLDNSLVYCTWFSGGLRVVDVADPFNPAEIAHYIPEPVDGFMSPQSNDVEVDKNGLIYLLDRNNSLEILELSQ